MTMYDPENQVVARRMIEGDIKDQRCNTCGHPIRVLGHRALSSFVCEVTVGCGTNGCGERNEIVCLG